MLPILILSINLLFCLIYYVIQSKKELKTAFFKLPLPMQKLYVLFVVGPLFAAPPFDPNDIAMSDSIAQLVGIMLFLGGLAIIILAFTRIGAIPSIRKESNLVTTGVYGLVRHPIYSGTVFGFFGWLVFFKSLIALAYFPLFLVLYFFMTVFEERGLVEEYGDEYLEYRKKVRGRLLPFIL